MPLGLLIPLFVLLGLCAAMVSAVETALLVLREHRVEAIAGDNARLRSRLDRVIANKRSFTNVAFLLSALCNLSLAAVGLILHAALSARFPGHPGGLALALVVGVVLATDLLPKLLCLDRPRGIFRLAAGPLAVVRSLLGPVADGLAGMSDRIVGALTPSRLRVRARFEGDELETLVSMRRDTGTLDAAESVMIQEVLKLRAKTAKDCMTPRVDVAVLADDLDAEEADREIRAQSHEHLPVYRDDADEVTGVLDVLAYLRDPGPERDFRSHVAPPLFVPETFPALELFEQHLRLPEAVAIVLDEFGGFEGLVTQTDIIEEILADAAPDRAHPQELDHLGNGRWLVAGAARLDDLSEATGVDFEEDGLDTIGGLVTTQHGSVPPQGAKLTVRGATVTVSKANGKRIHELLLEVAGATDGAPGTRGESGGTAP